MTALNGEYRIKNMERDDLLTMFELWKADEGLNSECTVDPFYNIDREGYFKGVIGNEMISSILALRYSPNFAFIGYYFVKEDY